jgi:putative N6-adenine-specific DNA methylase
MTDTQILLKDHYFASCPKNLEDLLIAEVKEFDATNISKVTGGIHFQTPTLEALHFLLNTKIASRVYKKIASFEVRKEKDIYLEACKIKWNEVFDLEQTFKIKSLITPSATGRRWSSFKNSMFLSMMLKDAIVDHFKEVSNGIRPDVSKDDPDVSFLLLTHPSDQENSPREITTVMIDLCGVSLAHRGYRNQTVTAPLRENLASALCRTILNENEFDYYLDSMCGSGTSLIEMFMQHKNLPGSYLKILDNKEFAFERLNFFKNDPKLKDQFGALLTTLTNEITEKLKDSDLCLDGSDLSTRNCAIARDNIKNARLDHLIIIKKADALELETEEEKGIIFANLPYGERLGDQEGLDDLYHAYGERLKKQFKGFAAYVFTGNMPLLKKISLRTSKKHIFNNAKIECRLARYELF